MCKIILLLMLVSGAPTVHVEKIEPPKCDMQVRLYPEESGDLTLAILGMTESRQFTISPAMRCCTWRFTWREGYQRGRLERLSDPSGVA